MMARKGVVKYEDEDETAIGATPRIFSSSNASDIENGQEVRG